MTPKEKVVCYKKGGGWRGGGFEDVRQPRGTSLAQATFRKIRDNGREKKKNQHGETDFQEHSKMPAARSMGGYAGSGSGTSNFPSLPYRGRRCYGKKGGICNLGLPYNPRAGRVISRNFLKLYRRKVIKGARKEKRRSQKLRKPAATGIGMSVKILITKKKKREVLPRGEMTSIWAFQALYCLSFSVTIDWSRTQAT